MQKGLAYGRYCMLRWTPRSAINTIFSRNIRGTRYQRIIPAVKSEDQSQKDESEVSQSRPSISVTLDTDHRSKFGQTQHQSQANINPMSEDGKRKQGKAESLLKNSATFSDLGSAVLEDAWSTLPYKVDETALPQQERPKIDPRETSVLLFPGQGTQYVGMGKNLLDYPNVKQLYSVASDILGYDLLKLCLEGPYSDLVRTVYAQPAVLVTSLAAVERLREEKPRAIERCVAAAGYSVGEYAALVFAGSLTFEDAVEIIKVRAEAMQRASELESSGLMTVWLTHKSDLSLACKAAHEYMKSNGWVGLPVIQIASYLCTEVKVIGGHREALQFIEENASKFNLLKTKMLPVSGAFHTPLMAQAREELRPALKATSFAVPKIRVYSNLDGKPFLDEYSIRKALAKQLVKSVAWEQTMMKMYDRPIGDPFPSTYEVGPGKQLTALLRRTNKKAGDKCTNVEV